MTSVLVLLSSGVLAHATESFELDVHASPDLATCVPRGILRAKVAERLGVDPFEAGAPRWVRVDIAGEGAFARVSIVLHGSGSIDLHRTLRAPKNECTDLTDAAALTIAVALDDLRQRVEVRPSPVAEEPTSAQDSPWWTEPAAAPPPPPPPPPAPSFVWQVFAGGVGSLGDAPAPSGGLLLGGGAQRGHWALHAEARIDAPAERTSADGTVRTALRVGSIVPCRAFGVLRTCLAATVGARVNEGVSVVNPRTETSLWSALGVRFGLEIPLGETPVIRAWAEMHAPLQRTVVLVGAREAYEPSAFAAVLGLALGARIP